MSSRLTITWAGPEVALRHPTAACASDQALATGAVAEPSPSTSVRSKAVCTPDAGATRAEFEGVSKVLGVSCPENATRDECGLLGVAEACELLQGDSGCVDPTDVGGVDVPATALDKLFGQTCCCVLNECTESSNKEFPRNDLGVGAGGVAGEERPA